MFRRIPPRPTRRTRFPAQKKDEKNRHGILRVKDTYEREPFYVSTDWNYVRFDVNDMQYEVVNGELYFYYD